ncbi:MAG: DNA gyrase subunit A, partial [Syntrophomonadaceae bacterium]|nr:DNA gyrase subunit A [Syntrophomonadaceae bacterium]
NALIGRFLLSEIQANAILDMRLVQLTGLERTKIEEEYQEILLKIADLEDILASPARVLLMIKTDLEDIQKKYGDQRRTEISYDNTDYDEEDFIEEHDVVLTLTNRGYIKRQPLDTYRVQNRGGKGISAASIRAEDFTNEVIVTNVLSDILFFTNQGRAFSCKAYHIPESSRQAKGIPLINLLELRPGEKVTTLMGTREFDNRHLVMVTREGTIKKVELSAFANIRRTGIIAINLIGEDELVGVIRVKAQDKIMLASSDGISIVFGEDQIRAMGRNAAGVRGIRLNKGQHVVGIDKERPDAHIVLVTEKGYGKRTLPEEFKVQNRGGKGVKTIAITEKNGTLVALKIASKEDEMVLLTDEGHIIRLDTDQIPVQRRYSRGVLLMKLMEEEKIVAVARFQTEKED